MLIGREAELRFLNGIYEESRGKLVFFYGRRRMGKTAVLSEFSRDKPHLYFSCAPCLDQVQLARFSEALFREKVPRNGMQQFPDWKEAFWAIEDLPYGRYKKLVVIDEFPLMCRGNSFLPSVLAKLWEEKLRWKNVMLILCGSAVSYIENELLAEKKPFHGMAAGVFKLKALDFYNAVKFFPEYSPYQKVLTYSVLGGVPYYLSQWDKSLPIGRNIRTRILAKDSPLYQEPDLLLLPETKETAYYHTILSSMALGAAKPRDIRDASQIGDNSTTGVYLRKLREFGIIDRFYSVDAQEGPDVPPGKKSYRFSYSFLRFWYTFVLPNLSRLEEGDVDGVYEDAVEPALQRFAALTFEDVCLEFVGKLRKVGKLPFPCEKLGRWIGKADIRDESRGGEIRNAQTQIAVMGIDSDAKEYLVGECWFHDGALPASVFRDLVTKLNFLPDGVKVHYYLFSRSGFDETLVKEGRRANVRFFSLEKIVDYR